MRRNLDARDALIALLSHTLGRRRDRYVEFTSRRKAQEKLFQEFYHQLAPCFDARHLVREIPAVAWSTPAYSYAPPRTFGEPWPSLRAAFDAIGEAQLLVTDDGRLGVHTQEDCFGGPLFIKA